MTWVDDITKTLKEAEESKKHQHRYTVVVEWEAEGIAIERLKATKIMCEGCGEIKEL